MKVHDVLSKVPKIFEVQQEALCRLNVSVREPQGCSYLSSDFYVITEASAAIGGLRCVCLRFIILYVIRLLAFLPLVCGLGTVFF